DASPLPALSGGGTTVTVGFDPSAGTHTDQIDPEDLTVANLVGALNKGLSVLNATAGGVFAAQRNGRIAFQVLSTEVNKLEVEGLAGAARAKLGFPDGVAEVLDNVKDVLRNLGALNLSVGAPIDVAVKLDNGTPQLRFGV